MPTLEVQEIRGNRFCVECKDIVRALVIEGKEICEKCEAPL